MKKGPALILSCELCGKTFDENWKLDAHKKKHVTHKCNKCDNTLVNQEIKEKHIKIAHENEKLYCHYFNNEKVCPFEDKCVFLHEKSDACKFGKSCERINCTFRHELYEDDSDTEEDDNVDNENTFNDENVQSDAERTFINPSQFQDEDFDKVVDETLDKTVDQVVNETVDEAVEENLNDQAHEPENFKCELCIFETTNETRFKRHTFENHSVKGKYKCRQCLQEFEGRKTFSSHQFHGCQPANLS